jgi:hypothetical protein
MPERFVMIVLQHMQPRALRPRTGGHVDAVMPALVAGKACRAGTRAVTPGVVAALMLMISFASRAQDGHAGYGHDHWHHGFYRTLQRPDAKGSCCNLTDCRPTSGRMLEGRYEVKVDGAWVSVPHTKILPKSAPDGGYHVCAPLNFRGRPEDLYCVILAPEG